MRDLVKEIIMNRSNDMMVSVIVLTYNQEHTVGRTIESILAQKTQYTFEIIIGEDASPSDNTRAVCEAYAEKYPDIIRLMPKAPNKGLLKNYADCLGECHGKYISGCAGDDWWHNPDKLQVQVSFLEGHPDYVLSYSGFVVNNVVTKTESIMMPAILKETENVFERLLASNFISAPTVCYRREMLSHIDFDEFKLKGFRMEDYPMWLIMARYGKFYAVPDALVTYCQSASSASNHGELTAQVDFEENTLMIKRYVIKRFGLQDKYSEEFLLNAHYRMLYNHSIRFDQRKSALGYIRQIRGKNMRDRLKIVMAMFPFTFKIVRKKNLVHSAI